MAIRAGGRGAGLGGRPGRRRPWCAPPGPAAPPRPPPLGINDCSGNAVEEVDRNVQGSTKERASVIGSLPQRYAIREMWPESLQVNLVMAESAGTHPQYKLKIFKDSRDHL